MTGHLPSVDEDRDAEAAAALRHVGGSRGVVPEIFKALAHSPGLTRAVADLGQFFREGSALDPSVRESVILVVAHELGSTYEWSQHAPIARRLGVDPSAVVTAPDLLPSDARAAVEAARRIARQDPLDADSMRRLIDACGGTRAAVEVCAISGYYAMLATLIESFGVQPDASLPLEPFPSAGLSHE
jgi:4-carboxymuconolactone decarboxylase